MRSDLSNEDIQNLDDVDEYDYLLQGEENVDGIDCYVLERTPKKGKETQYSRQVQWVRKDTLLRLRADYYDKKDRLVKKLFFSRQEKIDGIWTVTQMRVDPALIIMPDIVGVQAVRDGISLDADAGEQCRLSANRNLLVVFGHCIKGHKAFLLKFQ